MKTPTAQWKVTLVVLWAGMTGSILMYAALAYVLLQSGTRPDTGGSSLSILALPLSLIVPIIALVGGLAAYRAYARTGMDGMTSPTADPLAIDAARRRIQMGTILMLGIFEVVAIVGLVLFFVGAPFPAFARFAAANLALNVVGLVLVLQDVGRVEGAERRHGGPPPL